AGVETLCAQIKALFVDRGLHIGVDCLHGDRDQAIRMGIMSRQGEGAVTVLVATDIAARGLDVKNVRTVLNYDTARNMDTYVHRIGRTGRLGVQGVTPGTAYTLLTPADGNFAVDLVRHMQMGMEQTQAQGQGQAQAQATPIPADVLQFAMRDPKWRRTGGGGGSWG
ncbi:P-loop containing nucleoside triphosphate hydrolase protein, partial [Ochromonadaceae sp. CCMP2298]